jgi:molybdopterin molybdotransferase
MLSSERVPLESALGRVLREPVRAAEDHPAFDRSAVDGYAIRLDDPGTQFEVVDEIRAGDWKPRSLRPGQSVRIGTGGAIPCEGLQVVMKEDVALEGSVIRLLRRETERNIRFRGADARQGQVLVEAGTVLQPGTLALLASAGHTRPLVTRLPRIVHATTGNELVPPDQTPTQGRIRDCNSALVRAFLGAWGIPVTQSRLPEDEHAVRDAIRHAADHADLLLISGGASVGDHDFTRRLLEDLGYAIVLSKTRTRPGKPLIVAQRGEAIAMGLPGNPLAHFVCLNLFVRAALDALTGRPAEPLFERGVLDAVLEGDANARETFWPARCRRQGPVASLVPLRWLNSGDITSLAAANALIRVPGGSSRIPAGANVDFVPAAGVA